MNNADRLIADNRWTCRNDIRRRLIAAARSIRVIVKGNAYMKRSAVLWMTGPLGISVKLDVRRLETRCSIINSDLLVAASCWLVKQFDKL